MAGGTVHSLDEHNAVALAENLRAYPRSPDEPCTDADMIERALVHDEYGPIVFTAAEAQQVAHAIDMLCGADRRPQRPTSTLSGLSG